MRVYSVRNSLNGLPGLHNNLITIRQQIEIRSGLIRCGPNLMAQRAPSCAPRNAPAAMANAIGIIIVPPSANTRSAPMLLEALASFV